MMSQIILLVPVVVKICETAPSKDLASLKTTPANTEVCILAAYNILTDIISFILFVMSVRCYMFNPSLGLLTACTLAPCCKCIRSEQEDEPENGVIG